MKNLNPAQTSRRKILIKTVPTRVLTCLRGKGLLGMRPSFIQVSGLVIIAGLFVAAAWSVSAGQDSSQITAAEARKIIADGNREWGRARIALDRPTFEKMLAPDFYVLYQDKKRTRQDFIEGISVARGGTKLTRFDVTVLTVQPSAEGWVAVIQEKLEIKNPDGTTRYSLWVTRDGWKKADDGWVVTFSEVIGFENWIGGTKPPFPDW